MGRAAERRGNGPVLRGTRTVLVMRLPAWFDSWRNRFLERPGATVDLAPMRAALPLAAQREPALDKLTDEELTARAVALRADLVATPPAKKDQSAARELRAGLGSQFCPQAGQALLDVLGEPAA